MEKKLRKRCSESFCLNGLHKCLSVVCSSLDEECVCLCACVHVRAHARIHMSGHTCPQAELVEQGENCPWVETIEAKEGRTQQKASIFCQYSLFLDTHLRVPFRNHSFSVMHRVHDTLAHDGLVLQRSQFIFYRWEVCFTKSHSEREKENYELIFIENRRE